MKRTKSRKRATGRPSDWHANVPEPLLRAPPRLPKGVLAWRFTPEWKVAPSPQWKKFHSTVLAHRAAVRADLVREFGLEEMQKGEPERFHEHFAERLLSLFPAWATTQEKRGAPAKRVAQMREWTPKTGEPLTAQYKRLDKVYGESGALARAHRRARRKN